MRLVTIGCALATCMLVAAPAAACERLLTHGHLINYAASGNGGSDITPVDRGEELAVECASIGTPGADVSVVMALDPVQGEAPTGYSAVLLTDEHVGGKAVHFRVPDMPDLAHHTVTIRVYVTDAKGTAACDAGHLRIG